MRRSRPSLSDTRYYDDVSLVEIYHRFTPGLYRYAVRRLGDEALAEDCVAETFSLLIASLNNGGGPYEYLQAYLYSIAHNWITDQFRTQPLLLTEISPKLGSNGNDPARIVQERLEFDKVRSALTLLKPDQRQVIRLKYLEGRSNQEIAALLGKSIGAIRVLHHRGVVHLKRLLRESGRAA